MTPINNIMWKPEKYILVNYKNKIIHEDLDLSNYDDILGEKEDGWDADIIFKNNYDFSTESQEINIDIAIKTLQELKNDGCNYVEIMHHSDHHGYHFIGLEMREATEDEIKEYQEKKEILDKKNARIMELEMEIKKLKKNNQ